MVSWYRDALSRSASSILNMLSVDTVTSMTPAVFELFLVSAVWTVSAMGTARIK